MSTIYAKYHAIRAQRLQLQREVDALEQQEKDLMYEIQKFIVPHQAWDFQTDGYKVFTKVTEASSVTHWDTLLEYIKDSGAVDLLQKRVTESAVKARWAAGVAIPGVDKAIKYQVTITKETT